MNKRLLLLILASAAALSGCVTTAGYRSNGGYYGAASVGYGYGRSYPYDDYYGDGYSYRYDRYGRPYATYGYGYPYGGYGYGYPYGYYGGGYDYYRPHYHPYPGQGTNLPPAQPGPLRDLTRGAGPRPRVYPDVSLPDLTRSSRFEGVTAPPDYRQLQSQPMSPARIRAQRIPMEPGIQSRGPAMAEPSLRRATKPDQSTAPVELLRSRKAAPGR